MQQHFQAKTLATLVAGLCAALAQAQALPDAGAIVRDTTPPKINEAPRNNVTLPQIDASRATSTDTTPIHINQVRVDGATVFQAKDLEALVADLTQGDKTLGQLQEGIARITDKYRTAGYFLARAYIPQQDLKGGVLTILVMEGIYDSLAVENTSKLSTETVRKYLSVVQSGSVVSQANFDRALLILNNVPGIDSVNSRVEPGSKPGTTAVIVTTKPEAAFSGQIGLDNNGQVNTGRNRVTANVNANNALGLGERFNAQAMITSDKLYFGDLGVQLPLGYNGLVTNLDVGRTQYSLGGAYAALNAYGYGDSAKWALRYPLLRSLATSLYVSGGLEYRKLYDAVDATSTDSDKHLRVANVALNLEAQDGANGFNQASVMVYHGDLTIVTPSVLAIDQAGALTNGGYSKLTWSAARTQALANNFSLIVQGHGQFARQNLDSSEKFGIGGPGAVRAYPIGEAAGDRGYVASAELRYGVNANLAVGAFYDAGAVTVNAQPYLATPNSRSLAGAGLGLYGNYQAWSGSASLAWRTVGGPDQSQADKTPTLWLQAVYRF